jgi:L-lactate dehydrogenase (cytochrome)
MRQTKPELFDKLEVYVDGGIKRGTDVVKALCLGAKAVGLGRPVMYANGAYGQEGIEKMCERKYAFSRAIASSQPDPSFP